ncbi:contact-dependent growth inhibition system immunity protein [Kitasatospora aureofaciens]|uniref:contact-dependent growth inhibition system immunity protein n=1 Tax=Kitasatospora aureofaciens TaxID=1894 RepID=UPI001C48D666|nr:contact-dependent growth inhibition system immunity protein [Kitasatospora aureofaciens]MBV6702013.1 hypothetical protein [Kitasatospora aureofaciens]
MNRRADRGRSLEELERDSWPTPAADASRLVVTAHALRRKPIGELTVEDLRLLIRQNVGLPQLLPLAVEVLRHNPLAEGDLYEGDLLAAVLTRNPAVWHERPDLGRELAAIVTGLDELPPGPAQEVGRADFLLRPARPGAADRLSAP